MSDKTSDALLNCPFCGGEAECYTVQTIQYETGFVVKCKNLDCVMCSGGTLRQTIEAAIAAWNQRRPVERIVERLDKLAEVSMRISEQAAELGKGYDRHMIIHGAKGVAFEQAIEIVKEESGLNGNGVE